MKKIIFQTAAFSLAAIMLTGCATQVGYRDAGEASTLSTQFSRADVQQNIIAMVDSMLSNPGLDRRLATQFPGKTPTISVTHIRNETYQMGLNLNSMTDSIRTRLINSGKFDFIDLSSDDEMMATMMRDHNSALVDPNQAIAFGQQGTADYLLNGTLVEMQEANSRTSESYYKLNMQLINRRTGKIDWADEKEIRKARTRPAFGR